MEISKFLPIIGVLIFIIVLANTDIPTILNIIAGSDYILLTLTLLFHIPVLLLKSAKWELITHAYGKGVSLARCTKAWLVGFVIGIVTPGRIGELTKAYYLRDDMPTGCALSTVVVDRIIDILVLFTLAISGTLIFLMSYGILQSDIIVALVAFFVAFISATSFLLMRGDTVKRLANLLNSGKCKL